MPNRSPDAVALGVGIGPDMMQVTLRLLEPAGTKFASEVIARSASPSTLKARDPASSPTRSAMKLSRTNDMQATRLALRGGAGEPFEDRSQVEAPVEEVLRLSEVAMRVLAEPECMVRASTSAG